jgi:hypothetical protein
MQPIAERELKLRRPNGVEDMVFVRMWAPERDERGNYECRVEIEIPGEDMLRFSGGGTDGFQAVTFAIFQIPVQLLRFQDIGALSCDNVSGHWFPPILITPADIIPVAGRSERKPIHVTHTWAERILEFTPNDGTEPSRIFVKIGRPYTEPGMSGAWRVDLEIQESLQTPHRHYATGIDSFQALELAVSMIASLLEGWEERGRVTLDGGDHGFHRAAT